MGVAQSVGLQFQNRPPSRELRQQPESLSTPCSCACRCRSVTCNICTRKPTSCLKHMHVDKPIQPLLLPQQEQNREVQQRARSSVNSSRLLQMLLTQPQPQQEQNQEALQQSASSRLASSAAAAASNSSDFNMANSEVRWVAADCYHC